MRWKPRRSDVAIISLPVAVSIALCLGPARWSPCALAAKGRQAARDPTQPGRDAQRARAVDAAVGQAGRLIDAGKHEQAARLLVQARKGLGEERDPRVEGLLARAALALKQPKVALELAGAESLQEALHVAASPSLRLEAVGDLVHAYAAAGRYDQGLAYLEIIADKFKTAEAVATLEGLRGRVRAMRKTYLEDELATVRWRAAYLETKAVEAAQTGDERIQAFLLRRAAIWRERERELLGMIE